MDKGTAIWVIFVVLQALGSSLTLNLHHSFTSEELAHTFGAETHDQVPIYTATNIGGPLKLQDEANVITIDAFDRRLHFNVSLNKNLVARSHVTEFVHADGNITKVMGVQGAFSYGTVMGDPLSRVALHHSGRGLSGTIRTSDELYVISPLPHRFKEQESRDHVIYRASDNPDDEYIKKLQASEKEVNDVLESHKRAGRNRRAVEKNLPKKTIEILVAGDWKMLEFYGRDFLPTYLLIVVNIMQASFHDPTMPYPVDLAVVRTQILETDVLQGKVLSDLLKKWSVWCNNHNNFDDTAPDHFDTGLLVTRDGCSEGCGVVGLGNFDEACNPYRSQGVAVDKGFLTSIVLAHELGHVLGVVHDGAADEAGKVRCPNAVNIMGSSGNYGGQQALRYSVCSSELIEKTMRNPTKSRCFDDVPPKNLLNNVNKILLYGTVYNADKQCEYTYDRNFQRCIFEEEEAENDPTKDMCTAISCNRKGTRSCITRFFPALHGTSCGDGKWCIDAKCVPNGRMVKRKVLVKVNGGWSQWSDFTKCNKECNAGVRWKTRSCNSPKPMNGGRPCIGLDGKDEEDEEKGHFETCNEKACPGKTLASTWVPERDRQCGLVTKGNIFCRYCPVSRDPCGLWCGTRTSGTLDGKLSHGTYCWINSKHGICIDGKCEVIGCDNLLHSGNRVDRCGVCGGDGSTCGQVEGFASANFTKQGKYGTFFVATIPVGATDLKIWEPAGTMNFLQIKIGSKDSSALWKVLTQWYSKNVGGVLMKYQVHRIGSYSYQDKITCTGTLTEPLHIFYFNYYYRWPSKGVKWTYIMKGGAPSKAAIPSDWVLGEFGECSKTCAGGLKRRSVQCKRKDDKSAVGVSACRKANKVEPKATQTCNTQDCPGFWEITEWTKCSLTCATGTQTRRIRCMAFGTQGVHEVDESKCAGTKPTVALNRKCNDFSCTAYWDCFKSKVVCKRLDRGSNLKIEPDLECLAIYKTKPDDSVKCSKGGGDEDENNYEWRKQRQACAVGCGKGANMIEVSCHHGKTGEKADFKKCNNIRPPKANCGQRACGAVSDDMPDIYPIGCFNDDPSNRTVPEFVKDLKSVFRKSDPRPAIRECADAAKEKGYSFFALQSYGDCYIGNDETVETYDSGGKSTTCSSGSGGEGSNYVFKLGAPILVNDLPPVVNVGCLIVPDTTRKTSGAMASRWLDRMVLYCGLDAYRTHHEFFGGDSEGNCLMEETIFKSMDSKHFSNTCGPEAAGKSQYHVYTFIDINGVF